ncbi:MAG: hypothetical protein ACTSR0_03525 [Candidatus Asgardarchaeia archaeon]
MGDDVGIRVLPHWTFLRELAINVLSLAVSDSSTMEYDGCSDTVSGEVEDVIDSLNNAMGTITSVLENDLYDESIRDFNIHKNDKGVFRELLGREVQIGGFIEHSIDAIRSYQMDVKELEDFEHLEVIRKKSKVSIRMGKEPKLVLPQVLMFERWQSGYGFLTGRTGRIKVEIKASKPWVILLLSGFLSGYIGSFGEVYLSTIEESSFLEVFRNRGIAKRIFLEESLGFVRVMRYLKVPPRPLIPYLVHMGAELALRIKRVAASKRRKRLVRMNVYRIGVGRAIRLLEKLSLSPDDVAYKMIRYDDSVLKSISSKARKAIIYGRMGQGPSYSNYLKFSNAVYEAMNGIAHPSEVTYLWLRVLVEDMMNELKGKGTRELFLKECKVADKFLRQSLEVDLSEFL